MFDLIQTNPILIRWIAGLSLFLFIGTLLVVPYLIIRIPEDYFSHASRDVADFSRHHPALRGLILVCKNLLGILLVLLGIAMLVLPGQGILTILMGLVLVDFPHKYEVERWLVSRKRVFRAINWIRNRAGKPSLDLGTAPVH